MSLFCFPSAASSTIRARCTSLTLVSFERTSLVSSPRSSSVNTISVATRTIAPNYLAVVRMTLPNPDKFHQEQNTTLALALGLVFGRLRVGIRIILCALLIRIAAAPVGVGQAAREVLIRLPSDSARTDFMLRFR